MPAERESETQAREVILSVIPQAGLLKMNSQELALLSGSEDLGSGTRSLLDFVKVMERLGAAGASFVSVTQNFSTADAMGRLTMNMLMSFAEFEREIEHGSLYVGSPETVARKIAATVKALDVALTALEETRGHLEQALRTADYDPAELEPRLAAMCDKGLVVDILLGDRYRYMPAPFVSFDGLADADNGAVVGGYLTPADTEGAVAPKARSWRSDPARWIAP